MKQGLLLLIALSVCNFCSAASLKAVIPKTFSTFMKAAIDAQDAPAACWYLGTAQGYLQAMKDSGNAKAAKLVTEIKDKEGKCGGKNSLDLKTTFTPEEWTRLSAIQKKIESAEL